MARCGIGAKGRYELVCLLMKMKRRNVRARMKRKGLSDSAEDMVKFVEEWIIKMIVDGVDDKELANKMSEYRGR